jgi:hypothetical protein
MRFAIDRLCGPTALASFGVNERDTVDLEENLGLLHEFRAARLSFRKRLDGLVRGSRRGLGIFSLFPGPGPWAAEVAASRQAMILAKAEAASRLQSPGPEELPRDRIPRKGRTQHAGNLAAAFAENQVLLGDEGDALARPFRRGRLGWVGEAGIERCHARRSRFCRRSSR